MGIEAAKSRIAPTSRRIEWKHNGNIMGIDRACSEISAVTSSYISQKYLFGETGKPVDFGRWQLHGRPCGPCFNLSVVL